jgi:hypothetical protein
VLEAHSAQAAGPLTERTRRQLAAAQRRQAPEVYPAASLGSPLLATAAFGLT